MGGREALSPGATTATSGVSLRDVQNATPAESQEESSVMQALERNDPTGSSTPHLDLATGSLPPELNQTTEDELLAATSSINKMHHAMRRGSMDGPPPAQIFKKKKKDGSDADSFAANAGKLFHRFQKRAPVKQDDIEGGRKGKKKDHQNLESLRDFRDLVMSNKSYTIQYIQNMLLFVILPCTGMACLLFYVFENPGTTTASWWLQLQDLDQGSEGADANTTAVESSTPENYDPNLPPPMTASYSWWILFVGVRQVITFGVARAIQFLVVNYTMRDWGCGLFIGPLFRLLILQARGWPLHFIFWGIVNFAMLYGDGRFARHWLFYQDYVDVFNEANPAGEVLQNQHYRGFLIFSIAAGAAVAAKRFLIGLRFGKNSYERYAEKLSGILKEVVLVSRVAKSAQVTDIELDEIQHLNKGLDDWYNAGSEKVTEETPEDDAGRAGLLKQATSNTVADASLTESQTIKLVQLMGDWEEIDVQEKPDEEPSLSSIVQFRASVGILDSDLPFSQAFGRAKTRAQVIDCAQRLYFNLLTKQNAMSDDETESSMLRFHTIALAALKAHHIFDSKKTTPQFDEKMAKDLVKLFRPERDGDMPLLDFCKSIDSLYKEMRKLRASIANEGKMNAASEKFLNALFYFILGMIGFAVVGVDPLALFGFMSTFIVGFSFMISGASSDYFRGLLFILVQRPYDIGDRIAVAGPESDASPGGSAGWIVKDVTLYHTTVIFGTTQEYATYSNGALSASRIINAARSPRGTLNFRMKFGISVKIETIEEFREQVMAYVKSKPREWLNFVAFRMTSIEANQGYVEYIVILQHRESWQQIGALLTSLADVQSFAFDLSKSMGMEYHSPSLPVEMSLASRADQGSNNPLNNMNTALNSMFGSR